MKVLSFVLLLSFCLEVSPAVAAGGSGAAFARDPQSGRLRLFVLNGKRWDVQKQARIPNSYPKDDPKRSLDPSQKGTFQYRDDATGELVKYEMKNGRYVRLASGD